MLTKNKKWSIYLDSIISMTLLNNQGNIYILITTHMVLWFFALLRYQSVVYKILCCCFIVLKMWNWSGAEKISWSPTLNPYQERMICHLITQHNLIIWRFQIDTEKVVLPQSKEMQQPSQEPNHLGTMNRTREEKCFKNESKKQERNCRR